MEMHFVGETFGINQEFTYHTFIRENSQIKWERVWMEYDYPFERVQIYFCVQQRVTMICQANKTETFSMAKISSPWCWVSVE